MHQSHPCGTECLSFHLRQTIEPRRFIQLLCSGEQFCHLWLVGIFYLVFLSLNYCLTTLARQIETDIQTDRQADRQTGRQAGWLADRQAGRQAGRQSQEAEPGQMIGLCSPATLFPIYRRQGGRYIFRARERGHLGK